MKKEMRKRTTAAFFVTALLLSVLLLNTWASTSDFYTESDWAEAVDVEEDGNAGEYDSDVFEDSQGNLSYKEIEGALDEGIVESESALLDEPGQWENNEADASITRIDLFSEEPLGDFNTLGMNVIINKVDIDTQAETPIGEEEILEIKDSSLVLECELNTGLPVEKVEYSWKSNSDSVTITSLETDGSRIMVTPNEGMIGQTDVLTLEVNVECFEAGRQTFRKGVGYVDLRVWSENDPGASSESDVSESGENDNGTPDESGSGVPVGSDTSESVGNYSRESSESDTSESIGNYASELSESDISAFIGIRYVEGKDNDASSRVEIGDMLMAEIVADGQEITEDAFDSYHVQWQKLEDAEEGEPQYQPIKGATQRTFIPQEKGTYVFFVESGEDKENDQARARIQSEPMKVNPIAISVDFPQKKREYDGESAFEYAADTIVKRVAMQDEEKQLQEAISVTLDLESADAGKYVGKLMRAEETEKYLYDIYSFNDEETLYGTLTLHIDPDVYEITSISDLVVEIKPVTLSAEIKPDDKYFDNTANLIKAPAVIWHGAGNADDQKLVIREGSEYRGVSDKDFEYSSSGSIDTDTDVEIKQADENREMRVSVNGHVSDNYQVEISYAKATIKKVTVDPEVISEIIGGFQGNDGRRWFKPDENGEATATIKAADGFMVSAGLDGSFGAEAEISLKENEQLSACVKNMAGEIGRVSIEGVSFDKTEPSVAWEGAKQVAFDIKQMTEIFSIVDEESGIEDAFYFVSDERRDIEFDRKTWRKAEINAVEDGKNTLEIKVPKIGYVYICVKDHVGNTGMYTFHEGILERGLPEYGEALVASDDAFNLFEYMVGGATTATICKDDAKLEPSEDGNYYYNGGDAGFTVRLNNQQPGYYQIIIERGNNRLEKTIDNSGTIKIRSDSIADLGEGEIRITVKKDGEELKLMAENGVSVDTNNELSATFVLDKTVPEIIGIETVDSNGKPLVYKKGDDNVYYWSKPFVTSIVINEIIDVNNISVEPKSDGVKIEKEVDYVNSQTLIKIHVQKRGYYEPFEIRGEDNANNSLTLPSAQDPWVDKGNGIIRMDCDGIFCEGKGVVAEIFYYKQEDYLLEKKYRIEEEEGGKTRVKGYYNKPPIIQVKFNSIDDGVNGRVSVVFNEKETVTCKLEDLKVGEGNKDGFEWEKNKIAKNQYELKLNYNCSQEEGTYMLKIEGENGSGAPIKVREYDVSSENEDDSSVGIIPYETKSDLVYDRTLPIVRFSIKAGDGVANKDYNDDHGRFIYNGSYDAKFEIVEDNLDNEWWNSVHILRYRWMKTGEDYGRYEFQYEDGSWDFPGNYKNIGNNKDQGILEVKNITNLSRNMISYDGRSITFTDPVDQTGADKDVSQEAVYSYLIYGEDKAGNAFKYDGEGEGKIIRKNSGIINKQDALLTCPIVIDQTRPVVTVSMSGKKDKDGEFYYRKDNCGIDIGFNEKPNDYTITIGGKRLNSNSLTIDESDSDKSQWKMSFNADEVYRKCEKPDGECDGEYKVFVTATDLAGNTTKNVKTLEGCKKVKDIDSGRLVGQFVLDTTPPTYEFIVSSSEATHQGRRGEDYGNRYYFNSEFTVTASIDEENYDSSRITLYKGVLAKEKYNSKEVEMEMSDATGKIAISSIHSEDYEFKDTVNTDPQHGNDGIYRYAIFGSDKAGNPLEPKYVSCMEKLDGELVIDGTKKTADISHHIVLDTVVKGEINVSNGKENYYTMLTDEGVTHSEPYRREDEARISFKADDAETSPVKMTYKIESTVDGQNRSGATNDYEYQPKLTVDQKGEQRFKVVDYSIEDLAGNEISIKPNNAIYLDMQNPTVDKLAPKIKVVANAPSNVRGGNGQPLFNSDVPIEIVVNDPYKNISSSGLANITYTLYSGEKIVAEDTLHKGKIERSFKIIEGNFKIYEDEKLDYEFNKTVNIDSSNNNNDLKIVVTAADNSGNQSSAEYLFGIDVTSPEINVTYDNNDAQNEKYFKEDRTATVTVKERNFAPSKINIQTENIQTGAAASIDEWSHTSGASDNGDDDIWTTKIHFTEDGEYHLSVSGTDLVENAASETRYDGVAPRDFVLDKTAPRITVSYDNKDVRHEKYYRENQKATITVEDANFNGTNNIEVLADDGKKVPEVAFEGKVCRLPFDQDGTYRITGTVTDMAGNVSEALTEPEFVLDKTLPRIEIEGVEDRSANGDPLDIIVRMWDANVDKNSICVDLKATNHSDLEIGGESELIAGGVRYTVDVIEVDDYYKLTCTGTDLAGNVVKKKYSFSENQDGTVFVFEQKDKLVKVETEEKGGVDKEKTVRLYTNKKDFTPSFRLKDIDEITILSVTINGREVGYTYKANEETLDNSLVLKKEDLKSDNRYVINIETVDKAGNVSSMERKLGPVEFYIDRTYPVVTVTGIEDGKIYFEDLDIKIVHDIPAPLDKIETITLDGEESLEYKEVNGCAEIHIDKDKLGKHELKICVTDEVGNSTIKTYEFELMGNVLKRLFGHKIMFFGSFVALSVVLAGLLILLRKRKNGTQT